MPLDFSQEARQAAIEEIDTDDDDEDLFTTVGLSQQSLSQKSVASPPDDASRVVAKKKPSSPLDRNKENHHHHGEKVSYEKRVEKVKKQALLCDLSYIPSIKDASQLCWVTERAKSKVTVLPCFVCPDKDPKFRETKQKRKVHVQYFGNTHEWKGSFFYVGEKQVVPIINDDDLLGGDAVVVSEQAQFKEYMKTVRESSRRRVGKGGKSKEEVEEQVKLDVLEEQLALEYMLEKLRESLVSKPQSSKDDVKSSDGDGEEEDHLDDDHDDVPMSPIADKKPAIDMHVFNPVLQGQQKRQKLRTGDRIAYFKPLAVAGRDERTHAFIVEVIPDKKSEFPLKLDTGDFLERDHQISLIQRWVRGKHVDNDQTMARKISDFTLDRGNNGKFHVETVADRMGQLFEQTRAEMERAPELMNQETSQADNDVSSPAEDTESSSRRSSPRKRRRDD